MARIRWDAMCRMAALLCLLVGVAGWCFPALADEATFQRAVGHYKNFEIQDALKLFKELENSASSRSEKARAALFTGLCHAYLRNRDDALTAMKRAIQLDNSITIPADTPSRLRDLYVQARAEAGASGAMPPPRRIDAVPPRDPETKPPVREPDVEPPPRRRKMQFGFSFSVKRRTPPPPRRDPIEDPPPVRRDPIEEPPARRVVLPPPRRDVEDPPPARRVAATTVVPDMDPDAATKKPASQGVNLMLILGGVAMGVAAGLLGVGIWQGMRASSIHALGKAPEGQTLSNAFQIDVPQIQSDSSGAALLANVMYGAAGAVAIAGVVFFILSPRKAPPKKAADPLAAMPPTLKDSSPHQARILYIP